MCPGATSCISGTSSAQGSNTDGQRGWNGHPDGGLIGEGTSPLSTISSLSTPGREDRDAEISALVYG